MFSDGRVANPKLLNFALAQREVVSSLDRPVSGEASKPIKRFLDPMKHRDPLGETEISASQDDA
jgi:hypothetical protein